MSPVEVKQDSLNVIELTDLGASLQAVEDKIIIIVDGYVSGYECKVCKGTKQMPSTIAEGMMRSCDACRGTGLADAGLVIPDSSKSMPSTGVVMSMGPETRYMQLKKKLKFAIKERNDAAGQSDYPIYQEDVDILYEDIANRSIQIGTRVVFGVHVGTKLPFRGGIRLIVMKEKEPLCIVFGSDLGEKQLLDYTTDTIA